MLSVPGLASRVNLISRCNDNTDSIIETISFVTLFADSDILIEDFALRMNFATNSFGVEIVVNRTFDASATLPLSTSEMIVENV